jgi:hypothetical protein
MREDHGLFSSLFALPKLVRIYAKGRAHSGLARWPEDNARYVRATMRWHQVLSLSPFPNLIANNVRLKDIHEEKQSKRHRAARQIPLSTRMKGMVAAPDSPNNNPIVAHSIITSAILARISPRVCITDDDKQCPNKQAISQISQV